MSRPADSPQEIWQRRFLTCDTDQRTDKQRQGLDHPANWWYNPTNFSSLRLNTQGYHLVRRLQLHNWHFQLDTNLLAKHFLYLERYFTSPYYIFTNRKIVVWGEQESIMLALHGSNLNQYLDNLSENG